MIARSSVLLNARREYPTTDDFLFSNNLDDYDVIPGINYEDLNMSLPMFKDKVQTVKEEAIRRIKGKVQRYEWWGEKPLSKVIFLAILAALGGAIAGYLGIWIIFGIMSWVIVPSVSKFIRWLALGFRDGISNAKE